MAVNKLDPKIIFASEAPAQDTPAVFNNRTLGWGESRKNGGRPTIKQMNALQQDTELKILWLNENSVTPFDATIDYPVNAVTLKDGQFKIFNGTSWNLFLDKSSVGLNNVDNTSDLDKPISTAVKTELDYIDNNGAALPYKGGIAYEENAVVVKDGVLQQWKGGEWARLNSADSILDARGLTQQNINDLTGAKWRNKAGGYDLNARVMLDNGDIVKSTVAGNTVDPNVDMTGWVLVNDANQIFYGSLSQANINYELFNTPEKYGADKDAIDNTSALQAWLDSADVVHMRPFRTYKFIGTLNLSRVNQSIIGLTHNTYGQSKLQYTGTGTALKSIANIGYLTTQNVQLISQVNTVGAVFNLGTIGVDLSVGGNVDAERFFMDGFETLIKSAGNTYYNKFFNCRFNNFKYGLDGFASYNLQVSFCRFYQFTDAIRTVGGSGPINVKHNSFEQFNGVIHRSNNDKCHLNFKDNYVETFDKVPLPVNFTKATQQTKGDYFGTDYLFLGYYSKFVNTGNTLMIGGVYRVGFFSACDYLIDENNTYSYYTTGNNLNTLYSHSGTAKVIKINSSSTGTLGVDGGYSRTYNRSGFTMSSLRDVHEYYDWVLNAKQPLLNRLYNFSALENGWVISTTGGTTVKALVQDDGSTRLMGTITGSGKTANAILTIPSSHRPVELGTTQTYALFTMANTSGALNIVVLRYTYATGVLDLYGSPSNLVDIPLNINIPPRI